jgi:hypothetical protein
MPRRKLGKCVVCQIRKGRYAAGPTCDPCFHRVTAEKTAKELGVENPRHIQWRAQLDLYNTYAKQGKSLARIAELMGAKPQSLSSIVSRRARILGVKMVTTRKKPITLKQRRQKPAQNPRNEHGGGTWGVTGCHCTLCRPLKLAARAALNRKYRNEKRQARQQGQSDTPS